MIIKNNKFKIKKIDFVTAQKIWEDSPNRCVYNNPKFLQNYQISILGAFKGEELLCCWPIESTQKKEKSIPDFFYYFGPYWSNMGVPNHSLLSLSQNIYNEYINIFDKKNYKIDFQLHYSLKDIRPFSWWNYGNKKKKFFIYPKYTAIIDIDDKEKKNLIKNNYRYVRRYEIKKFAGYQKYVEFSNISLTDICSLYFNSNKNLSHKKINLLKKSIKKLYHVAKKGFGKIICLKDRKSKKVLYFNLVLFDKNSAHLVLNCSDDDWRKKGIMSWGLDFTLSNLCGSYKYFDFNGANSPNRGDDKHSYGSQKELYFELKY